jgi:hypothetical protein
MGAVAEKQSVVEQARQRVEARPVRIHADTTGVVPMERRVTGPDGRVTKLVSSCDYTAQGKMTNVVNVRPLNFGADGVQMIDPRDPEDADLLRECKLWLEDGSDGRIAKFNIRIDEDGAVVSHPIGSVANKMKAEALIARMTEDVNYLADDPVAVRSYLERAAQHELQRVDGRGKASRSKVLDAIEDLGVNAGVEYGTDAVDEL